MGDENAAPSSVIFQRSLPEFLSKAASAPSALDPTLRMHRSPSMSGELAAPHVGWVVLKSLLKSLRQRSSPAAMS